ncbi:hypothetical protein OCK74_27805, partial [Chitinophagaceae bacterium LB-8]|nr:hypothetical protein [Paraflavisolibacter caeni]
YMFYKVLKAGYTICYQADAYVWHKHRSTMAALYKQIYDYSRGGVAYHLTTWLHDSDWRGLRRIAVEIPKVFCWHIKEKLRRRSNYPLFLIWLEFKGYLAGPWAYWCSHRRVKKLGKSNSYLPLNERHHLSTKLDVDSESYLTETLQIIPSEQPQ